MDKWLLPDTDVLIDFFRGHDQAVDLINTNSSRIILSAIVVAELYAGIRGSKELSVLQEFISLFEIIPVSLEIAEMGGLYKRDFGKSHGLSLADAVIAASCTLKNAELKTLNVKHYPMIKNLQPAYIKT